jgi:hypothetical protein
MLGFFHAITLEDAFALFVNLQHVELGLFAGPAENNPEDVSNVIHVVDRIIPTNDQIARFQTGLRFFFCCLNCARGYFGRGGPSHGRKI